ncbi:RNAse H [Alkalihalobacillus alcalophilus ATCC 27647 = CGMCC 1.3604]|uniref:RNAse H n=2 Tax=Alkalihalobacillus alcalophilus TaxID=1445 RepID=A0A4S4JVG6_ALKAL|nr:RNAse H [Alkalihalobacillus alcalophilus ATCC 27647 = CGMCC 1.3604]
MIKVLKFNISYKAKKEGKSEMDDKLLKEVLLDLEEKLLKPEIRTSKAELTHLLSEDFFEFGSSGKVLYKNESIGEVSLSAVRMKLSDFEIHPLSEQIVLTTYRVYNEVNGQHSLRSSIWRLTDGKWKMQFHQGTPTSPSP